MGLAAPKNRSRIGNDPNNTSWANNTARFGHRILEQQGWKPGQTLGSKNASHSTHYTAASNSHIRVLLKDDNLGLGAKRGSERAENFGLAALESVLGRLNGKQEEVKKEEERRAEVDRRGYIARRYGFMNFVSGGLLVGDKIQSKAEYKAEEALIKKEEEDVKIKVEVKEEDGVLEVEEKKVKKRKRSRDDEDVKAESNEEQPKLKRKKKSMDLREEAAEQDATEKKSKKGKKDKSKSAKTSASDSAALSSVPESPASAPAGPLSDKAKRKAEKKARKEEKKLKKALKKAAKEAASVNKASSESSSEEETETSTNSSVPTSGVSTPSGLAGRHAVRQRYIMQKKRASMDPQALKEIFMIKSPA